ncbi:MAG: lipoate--protein ligase family protein [Planctomycetes bacterium]|nr:lipoate--protein ligase family protein [Planctomycetota bacterium]
MVATAAVDVPELPPAAALAWSEARLEAHGGDVPVIALWRPAGVTVALGLAQRPDRECDVDALLRDGVGLVRRQSGGGAVLLYSGVLCWEAFASEDCLRAGGGDAGIRPAYRFLSQPVVAGLRALGIAVVSAGTCDLSVVGDDRRLRKVAGTAQLRRRGSVLVHGSLLVDADLDRLARYLAFPSEQPEYRADRSHGEFCTTVAAAGGLPAAMAAVTAAIHTAAREMHWSVTAPSGLALPEARRFFLEKYAHRRWNWERDRTPAEGAAP